MNPRPYLLIAALIPGTTLMGAPPSEGERILALHVSEILAEKCIACHSPEPEHKLKGGLDMSTLETILTGGDSGEVLVPGDAEDSLLFIATTWADPDYEMPPKEADRLSEEQQGHLRDWINAGAPWVEPSRLEKIRDEFATGQQVETSEALSEDWQNRRYEPEKLWAYRPLAETAVPEGANPIDHFLDASLAERELEPAPDGDAHEVLRRLTFGLTGLPPAPEEIAAFEEAYTAAPEAAVREKTSALHATPQFGEHFGRHWLDVARYADSSGFANDYARPNAWRYRDYVVRSFNDDKPYPQFVREQIAGDELATDDPDHVIATGFLRMGAWEQTSMSVFRVTRQQWIDDATDSVGQAFLAHAMQCAKCHDHKFDPVPTRDYYSMAAVFSTTQFVECDTPFTADENQTGFGGSTEITRAKIAGYQRQTARINAQVEAARASETGPARTGDNGLDPSVEASQARIRKNIQRHQNELDRVEPIALAVYTGNTIERKNVNTRIQSPNRGAWGQGYMEEDHILTGGDIYTRGDAVTPGALSAAESLGGFSSAPFPAGQGARRLALADWIADEENPLTARVMVNRIWSWHFGQGLAGNPNNFGGTGALPTHPELLDHLAGWFMENGWSVKKLSALITSSRAYRRSSRHPDPEALAERDPLHQHYAIFLPRRLVAEELRDAMLSASGELNPQVGGIPARPDINAEVALQPRQIMGGTASVYEPDPLPEQRNRRSIYAERLRGLRDPFLETFNQPGSDQSCELRDTSTVAPQALTLFNTPEVHDRALALANDLITDPALETQNSKLETLYLRLFSRAPTDDELQACLDHWQAATAEEEKKTHVVPEFPIMVERTVMAEKTGEPYSFFEHMPAYKTYVPDLTPQQVDARTRGLAQVCLVLLNTNEFAYLD